MSKDNFESIIGELMKGPANIESVNFHFGDCNSTTYMGGEVEEEYEEDYGCDDCGCCPGDMPVVDNDRVAEWVQKKTGIELATIEKVLEAEMEYLEEIGAAISVGTAGNGEDAQEQDGVPAGEDHPEQTANPEQSLTITSMTRRTIKSSCPQIRPQNGRRLRRKLQRKKQMQRKQI